MKYNTTTAREAQKVVLNKAAETSAAFQMGRVVEKAAKTWLSQRFEVLGVKRKTFDEDRSDLNVSEQLKCRGTCIKRASLNTDLSPFSSNLHEHS